MAEELHVGFWWGDTLERDHFEDLDVDGVSILKEVRWGGMNWIFVAEDRYRRRAFVPAVMNLRFP